MRTRMVAALAAVLWAGLAAAESGLPAGPLFMGYYESWNELPVEVADLTTLAQMPASLDILAIAFVRPDLAFDGSSLAGTGLQGEFSVEMLASAIAAYKKRSPKTKVILSVGGSSYNMTWGALAAEPLARLVRAVGADGVDLDYEPKDPRCARSGRTIQCAADQDWIRSIKAVRAVLPRPYVLTAPVWSVGAYGVGAFASDLPPSRFTGSMLWLAGAPEARELDAISIMAYDSGPAFDPERALAAYHAIWPGPVLLGMSLPPDSAQGAPYTVARMKRLAAEQATQPKGGVMIYAVNEDSKGGPSLELPDGEMAAKALCEGLGRKAC